MSQSIDSARTLSEKKRILLNLLLEKEKKKNVSRLRIPSLPRDTAAFPLSFAQQRLWFLDQLEAGNPFYNISASIRFSGPLSVEGLEQTLSRIVRRHEVLRTTFTIENDQPVQVINPAEPIRLPVLNLSGLSKEEAEKELRRVTHEDARRGFDLTAGPLLRVNVVRGWRHTMLNDSDIHSTRHARAAVGGVIASVVGRTAIYVSGGAEHQGPPGGGPVAVVARSRDTA